MLSSRSPLGKVGTALIKLLSAYSWVNEASVDSGVRSDTVFGSGLYGLVLIFRV